MQIVVYETRFVHHECDLLPLQWQLHSIHNCLMPAKWAIFRLAYATLTLGQLLDCLHRLIEILESSSEY